MKILQVSECYFPAVAYGGPIDRMRTVAKGLIDRGHQVHVHTSDILTQKTGITPTTIEKNLDGISITYFRSFARYRWNSFSLELLRTCHNELKKFDLIHVYGYRNFFIATVSHFAHQFQIPYLLEPLGSVKPMVRSFAKKWLFDRTIGNLLLKNAIAIISNSEMERNTIISCGVEASKIELLENALDLSIYDNLPSPSKFREAHQIFDHEKIILYVGRIFKIKTLELLIEAFSLTDFEFVRLVIAGPVEDENYFAELKALTLKFGVDRKVIFIGTLQGEAKLEAYSAADLFVSPSSHENFGNTIAEAIASGIPVVVTDRCGIAPMVKDQVGLVVEHSSMAISSAIKKLMSDRNLRENFAVNTKFVREKFSSDWIIDRLEEIYTRAQIGNPKVI